MDSCFDNNSVLKFEPTRVAHTKKCLVPKVERMEGILYVVVGVRKELDNIP